MKLGIDGVPAVTDTTDTRELELELVRVRAEARAARLEARAAEIELMLRRSAIRFSNDPISEIISGISEQTTSGSDSMEIQRTVRVAGVGPEADVFAGAAAPVRPSQLGVTSWDDLLRAASLIDARPSAETPQQTFVATQDAEVFGPFEKEAGQPDAALTEHDEEAGNAAEPEIVADMGQEFSSLASHAEVQTTKLEYFSSNELLGPEVEAIEQDIEQGQSTKKRPLAWVVSVLAHAAVLLLLAGMTLSVQEPKDQIALSASAVQSSSEAIETMVLEQTEQPESTSESPSEALAAVNPIGDIASEIVEVSSPGISQAMATAGDPLGQLLGESVASGVSSPDVSATFFGASGGGNHFVYLVDSSGSMDAVSRDGFDVARAEVLRAVDSLDEKQRFYVIFFGEETWRMKLANPAAPEDRSVYATAENKAALRRWAMTLKMQPGKWPKEALEFSFTLRPDCVFLLTDGAMPDYVADMVAEKNIVETLLDGPKPRSIFHTIGFHNPEGEKILSKIAKDNGGTYHFVPANASFRR
jgi:hypothetical protein